MTERPSASDTWSLDDVRHLLGRVSFAVDETQAARLHVMPRQQAIDLLLKEAQQAAPPTAPEWVQSPWINTERRYASVIGKATRSSARAVAADWSRWWIARAVSRCWARSSG